MNELYHHGILGQKWGIRRYQNDDGTLTPEGKKKLKKNTGTNRYLNDDDSLTPIGQKLHKRASSLNDKMQKLLVGKNITNSMMNDYGMMALNNHILTNARILNEQNINRMIQQHNDIHMNMMNQMNITNNINAMNTINNMHMF